MIVGQIFFFNHRARNTENPHAKSLLIPIICTMGTKSTTTVPRSYDSGSHAELRRF